MSTLLQMQTTYQTFSKTKYKRKQIIRVRCEGIGLLSGPPIEYDYKNDVLETTQKVINQKFPHLMDLVEEGNLVAFPRPENYKERREDGYIEPELVILFGTAHVSEQSAQDVKRIITTVKPQNVVVELCKSRPGIMYEDKKINQNQSNLMGLAGTNFLESVVESVKLGGTNALFLRVFLGMISRRLLGSMKVKPGREFVAARQVAEELNAQIVLGDRPIEITLERAWDALNFNKKLILLQQLLLTYTMPIPKLDEQIMQQLKSDDAISMFFTKLGEQFPELLSPLIHERDLYLAWSLKRSKAVNGSKIVVGVVGKGHLRGITYAILRDDGGGKLRFTDLVGGKNTREYKEQQRKNARIRVIQELALAIVLSAAWGLWTTSQANF